MPINRLDSTDSTKIQEILIIFFKKCMHTAASDHDWPR